MGDTGQEQTGEEGGKRAEHEQVDVVRQWDDQLKCVAGTSAGHWSMCGWYLCWPLVNVWLVPVLVTGQCVAGTSAGHWSVCGWYLCWTLVSVWLVPLLVTVSVWLVPLLVTVSVWLVPLLDTGQCVAGTSAGHWSVCECLTQVGCVSLWACLSAWISV